MGTTLPARPASSAAAASRFSFLRLAITTAAPASASRAAIALPIPRPPPVTRATLPVKSIVCAIAITPYRAPSDSSRYRSPGPLPSPSAATTWLNAGESRVLGQPADVSGVDLLGDHRDLEQAADVIEEHVRGVAAGRLAVALDQLATAQAAGLRSSARR